MTWLLRTEVGRIVLFALFALAVIAAFALWQRNIGAQHVKDQIKDQNDAAISDAQAAELGLRECLDRSASDGVFWDFSAGVCRADP